MSTVNDIQNPEPRVLPKREIPRGICTACGRSYALRNDGNVAMHAAHDNKTDCPGSRKLPEGADPLAVAVSVPRQNTYSTVDAAILTGANREQLTRWARADLIHPVSRNGGNSPNRFDADELYVASVMVRLLDAGFNDLQTVAALARKHVEGLATLRAIGYDGDSNATEHTVGDGLVLTITETPSWRATDSPRP